MLRRSTSSVDTPYMIGYIVGCVKAICMERLMTRTFIQTYEFSHKWDDLGFTDEDLRRLEWEILQNPKIGAVIPGTGKLRKMRFAFSGQGKRGSSRVCYVDFVIAETVYLITIYVKNEKENLTKAECAQIKKMIDALEKNL